jgi:hypothetical protein
MQHIIVAGATSKAAAGGIEFAVRLPVCGDGGKMVHRLLPASPAGFSVP